MAEVAFDVLELILVGFDVKNIIPCKSVCKSWHAFITSPRFVKAHLNHNYKKDRDNHELGHRRIANGINKTEDLRLSVDMLRVVGSSNGLVCVSPRDVEFVVTNPSTGEFRKLPKVPYTHETETLKDVVCLGFGYDSSTDDYKVVAGFKEGWSTPFYILTLKSNIWKFMGEVKYRWCTKGVNGVLCGETLYWFMSDATKRVIISFNLSTEKFKFIPQPTDGDYGCHHCWLVHKCYALGVLDDCLCIYSSSSCSLYSKIWVMKNSKWERYYHCRWSKNDIVHRVQESQQKYVYTHDDGMQLTSIGRYMCASIFVNSLVSPNPLVISNNSHYKGRKRNAMEQDPNESVEGDVKCNIRKMN
ncbi:hypothetical protein QVD17_36783 [Tagetes erecta]|uniref:F-box domain-containing protein n=1 Tax=Tagetes erecta TaxID=13708 RepID=A0AAD8JUV6_TARER|nr:hypothetical protein QVD17_36783 [Tagetes erecta]